MTPTPTLKMRILTGKSQNRAPNTDPNTISRSILERGIEHVVSYDGTSQYNREGTGAAACGLAALNFARIVFLMEQANLPDIPRLQAVLSRKCAEVRRIHPLPDYRLIFSGSHFDMWILVRQRSS